MLHSLIEQILFVTTVATALATVGMMPRFVREDRLSGILLLALVALAGAIATWRFHQFWLAGAVVLVPGLALLFGRGRAWKAWASIYAACVGQNAAVYLLSLGWMVLQSAGISLVLGSIVWVAQAISVVVTFPFTYDLLNVLGRRSFPARDLMLSTPEPDRWPGCCFQVPAHNEPPELLARVIKQLLRQQYPGRWMIQVIDNNTPDPATWKPIQQLCQQYNERVQFLHLEHWPGFKAGALNEGTRRLPDWVELIAVVDADYLVDQEFLCATVRHFADPEIAFVQTPQHYREWQGNPYFEGLNYMYETFFATYMTSRRESNGIICAGTMGLVRRSCLEQVGLWDEESVTEDAELSFRLLGKGWRGVYDHRSYGAGLMPFEFDALKKQRFRWAFGTIQLLLKHWKPLLGLSSPERLYLTPGQRLCYLGLGIQYLIEAISFFSTLLLVVAVSLPALGWHLFIPSLQLAILIPMLLLLTNFVRTVWGLREATGCKLSQATGAFLFFFALSWVTCRACISACLHKKGVFLRTPKVRESQKWRQAVRITAQETLLSMVFVVVAILTLVHDPANMLPAGLLALQGMIYGMAPLCALAASGIWLLPSWLLGTSKRLSRAELSVQTVLLPRPRGHLPAPEWDRFVPANGSAHRPEGVMSWQNAPTRVLAGSDCMFIRLDPEHAKRSCDPKQGMTVARRSDETTTRKEIVSPDELGSAFPGLSHVTLLLRELFTTVLAQPLDQVSEQCDFFEAGGDSLALASLLLAIERHFQVSLDPLAIYDHPVLSDLAVLLAKRGELRTPGPIYEAMHS